MLESEAKEKWCPFSRLGFADRNVPAFNRVIDVASPRYETANISPCIGSLCMAWRWTLTPKDAEEKTLLSQIECSRGERDVALKFSEHGYCGLAGKP